MIGKLVTLLNGPFGLFLSALGLLLSGVIPIVPFVLCFPLSLISSLPIAKALFGAGAIAASALAQWWILTQHIPLDRNKWLFANIIGIVVGIAVGVTLAGQRPQGDLVALGWEIYDGKVFSVAGICLGLVLWLALRSVIKNTGWLCVAGGIAGLCAGTLEGSIKNDYILGLGDSSNDLGERLIGASLVATPSAFAIFEVLIGASLAIILLQYLWQKRHRQ